MSIVACANCGAKNRVDERSRNLQPVCGKCGTKLSAGGASGGDDGHPVVVTDATFDRVLRGAAGKPVLVDCWAAWCGPCRMIAPTLDQLAAEAGGRYVVAKLNVDENPKTAQHFRVSSIPTLLIFKNSQLVDQIVGLSPKPAIAAKLMQYA